MSGEAPGVGLSAEKVTELIAEARNKVTNAEYSRARGIGESTYSLELMVTALADALSSLRDAEPHKAKVWCLTHDHVHIGSIPRFTYQCKMCGWGQWYGEQAKAHEEACPGHETYEVEHVVVPLTDPRASAPVRDAEPDRWEYGLQWGAARYETTALGSRAEAERSLAYNLGRGTEYWLVRRTPEAEAGPWLPVPEGNQ